MVQHWDFMDYDCIPVAKCTRALIVSSHGVPAVTDRHLQKKGIEIKIEDEVDSRLCSVSASVSVVLEESLHRKFALQFV